MPRPVYIICCRSQSLDAITGLISHFGIIQMLQVAIGAKPPPNLPANALPWLDMIASATWMREGQDDPNQEYDYQFVLQFPHDQSELMVAEGRFIFEKPFHRFDITIRGQPFIRSGTHLVESRIRQVGHQEWLKQNNPIIVDVFNLPRPQQT